MRKQEFDIMKGLLIILVVIGHLFSGEVFVHNIIYWFHMPVFFMVSGYFFKCPLKNPFNDMSFWVKKLKMYVLPYLMWSAALFIIFRPESILKNVLRVLYAGGNNVTLYSYPFWFFNALFVSVILLSICTYVENTYKLKYCTVWIAMLCYVFIHTPFIPPPNYRFLGVLTRC